MSLRLRIALSSLHRPVGHRYGPHPSQVADLHLPLGEGPHPVAVVLHGGHWRTRYGKLVTRPACIDLAARGWAAWNVEYRRLGEGGGWPATFDDVAAAIDHLATLDDPRLDLDRVTVLGHSAGGHLALWAGARPALPEGAPGASPVVVARELVALAAICNLQYGGRIAHLLVGGSPEEVPERWLQADPAAQVPLSVPVLLVHAVDDRTVSVEQSRRYAAAANQLGGEVTLVEPETGGHRAPIYPVSPAWLSTVEWLEQRASRHGVRVDEQRNGSLGVRGDISADQV
jgi:acetyl esterase/lipase